MDISPKAIIKVVFDLPASVVIICGRWKTGKTDFSLLIAEMLLEMKGKYLPILKCATNIQTERDERFEYIDDMVSLKKWLFGDHISKLFIYDEAIKSTPSRRAMSKLNTKWLEIIPELSKGKCKLIAITQELDYTESIFCHRTFLRGIFQKLSRERAYCFSHLLEDRVEISDIPRCKVRFYPYRVAKFSLGVETLPFDFKDKKMELLWRWSQGEPCRSLGLHPQQLNRMTREFVKKSLRPIVMSQNKREEV